jgi:hypothetical protein
VLPKVGSRCQPRRSKYARPTAICASRDVRPALHHQHLGLLVESTQPSRTRRAAATPPTMITFMMSLGFGLS